MHQPSLDTPSCRFSPAHRNGDVTPTIEICQKRPGLVARNVPSLAAHGGDAMCSKPPSDAPISIHALLTLLLTAGFGGLNLCSLAVPRFGYVLLSAAIRLIPPPRPYSATEEAL